MLYPPLIILKASEKSYIGIAMTSWQLKDKIFPHRLILAPMCGITLKPFRQICKEYGAGLVFNQMVSAKALTMKDTKSLKMLDFDEMERPVGMQLFGNDADVLAEAAKICSERNPDVIDLNLGCPAKKIVNDGGGSALLNDSHKLEGIFKKMRAAIPGVFTIKIRAGWDEKNKNALDIARMAEFSGIDAIAIHARTRAQGYSGSSDWDFIKQLKESTSVPIIGNGDIKKAADVKRMINETGCDAVMTGRAAFAEPWIFKNFIENTDSTPGSQELKNMILRQYDYFVKHFGTDGGIKMMRKFLCAYTKGMRGGAEFRNDLVRITNYDEIQRKICTFYSLAT